jgi:tRNA uridine 5-carboxymethylaminomethyl modification enzyme
MMTSRSEYRISLRQDNTIFRLSEQAYQHGFLSEADRQLVLSKKREKEAFTEKWKKTSIPEAWLTKFNLSQKLLLSQFVKRPEIELSFLVEEGLVSPQEREAAGRAMVEFKYEGYLEKQKRDIEKLERWHNKLIPTEFNYAQVKGLKTESLEKFQKYRPKTLFEAQKIAGINPADMMVLVAFLE